MKHKVKIFSLFALVLLASCYHEIETNPDHPEEYLAVWSNSITTINGVPDDVYPNNKVPHYIFQIGQSDVTLPTSSSLGIKYQNWKIDKTTNPVTLKLYKESFKETPDMLFKVIKEPLMGEMHISYSDSIVYYLKK